MKAVTLTVALGMVMGLTQPVWAVDTDVQTGVNETAQDAKKTVRKGARKAKDKTCELVNGKLECAAKKLKHKAENTADEVKDKVE